MRFARRGLVLILAVSGACSPDARGEMPPEEAGPIPGLRIRPGAPRYTARTEGDRVLLEVTATLHNGGTTPVRVHTCGRNDETAPSLQQLVEGAWKSAWVPICSLVPTLPIRIAPGATLEDTVSITGYTSPHRGPGWTANGVAGTYRLLYQVASPGADTVSAVRYLLQGSRAFTVTE